MKSDLLPGELAAPAAPAPRPERASQVVAAALQLLESEGSDALTMRRLAGEIGIQAPSLYKHFVNKAAVEQALIEDGLREIGIVSHRAIHEVSIDRSLGCLLATYRRYSVDHPNLYRLATSGTLNRGQLPEGLENWAGNPWYVVTGDPALAQALWSFAHGMVVLELGGRYPEGSDLDATWRAGAEAFEVSAAQHRARLSERSSDWHSAPGPPAV